MENNNIYSLLVRAINNYKNVRDIPEPLLRDSLTIVIKSMQFKARKSMENDFRLAKLNQDMRS